MDIKTMVAGYKDEMIDRIGKLVAIHSVESESEENAPFGKGPAEALNTALQMLADDGFKTVNLDNYIGYAEIGEGDQTIGVVGHLDVVPAVKEDGWNSDPFEMVIDGDTLYGRGVADDKGAVVASMVALKVIRDLNVPLNKKIRLIMGTNEETGSKCLAHYVQKEGDVDYGFTPDGDFPCVHGEKGMVQAKYFSKSTTIRNIRGGTAKNVVCPKVTIEVEKCSYSGKTLTDFFHNNNIDFIVNAKEDSDEITVIGKAAHASIPHLGVNAISWLFAGLKAAGFQDPFVDFYTEKFGLETNGESLECALVDEYGALTLNCGVISMQDGIIEGSIDIRFPVTMHSKTIVKALVENGVSDGGEIEVLGVAEPLFFQPDSPLITSLVSAYQEVTGDTESKPFTLGGGTYAKGIKNTVAFGCAFPGKDYRIHDANEWVPIDELLLQAEIYVKGILKLLEL